METFNGLSNYERNMIFCALEILGEDIDAAWCALQDEGIEIGFDDLQEISEYFSLGC